MAKRGTPANQLGSAAAEARAFNFLSNVGSKANRKAAKRGYNNAMNVILGGGSSTGTAGKKGG